MTKDLDRATLKISNNSTECDKSSIIDEIKRYYVKQLGEYLLLTSITDGFLFRD